MPSWLSNGALTNPAIDTILADTGPFNGSSPRSCSAVIASTVAAVVFFEYRDAANAANVKSQAIPVAANELVRLEIPNLDTLVGERYRLRLNAAVTGVCQGSLFTPF
jgi:hypothetical protein